MTWRTVVVGWLASLAGFLVGEYGAGLVLILLRSVGSDDAVLTWSWLPWALAPVLAGISGAVVPRCDKTARWWQWVLVGLPVPVGAWAVTVWYFAAYDIALPDQAESSVLQIAMCLVVTVGVGMYRVRYRRTPKRSGSSIHHTRDRAAQVSGWR